MSTATMTMKPERFSLRPTSMAFSLNPPLMDITEDTLPELFPIFTFLNSHSNKLYQEGYFLKLNDLDSRMYIASGECGRAYLTRMCRWTTLRR